MKYRGHNGKGRRVTHKKPRAHAQLVAFALSIIEPTSVMKPFEAVKPRELEIHHIAAGSAFHSDWPVKQPDSIIHLQLQMVDTPAGITFYFFSDSHNNI